MGSKAEMPRTKRNMFFGLHIKGDWDKTLNDYTIGVVGEGGRGHDY
jgi:hypothetical protein